MVRHGSICQFAAWPHTCATARYTWSSWACGSSSWTEYSCALWLKLGKLKYNISYYWMLSSVCMYGWLSWACKEVTCSIIISMQAMQHSQYPACSRPTRPTAITIPCMQKSARCLVCHAAGAAVWSMPNSQNLLKLFMLPASASGTSRRPMHHRRQRLVAQIFVALSLSER